MNIQKEYGMNLYIKTAILYLSMVVNVNISFSATLETFPSVGESDAEIQSYYKNYNDNDENKIYESLLSRSGGQPDKEVVFQNISEKKKAIGQFIKSELKYSEHASPNLQYLFYESNYEYSTVLEFFCVTRDLSTKKLRITVDQVDTDNQMRNEGDMDDRVHQAVAKVNEFRELYNKKTYESFHNRVDFGSKKYVVPKEKFLMMMREQNKNLGKYISAKLLFSRSKNNGVVLTYLSQYEKYAVVELWGVIRDSPVDAFRLRVYEVF